MKSSAWRRVLDRRLALPRERTYITHEIDQDLSGCIKHDVMRRSLDLEEFFLRRLNVIVERLRKS